MARRMEQDEPGRGCFITLEGGEGSGKSTQVQYLKGHLEARDLQVMTTREPGGSAGAEAIRKLLVQGDVNRWDAMSELLLLFAARNDHLQKVVLPALEAGKWVISDRFADSTMAYQGYTQGLGDETVQTFYDLVCGAFKPDLTLILDLPVEIGLARAGNRNSTGQSRIEDRYERMGINFHTRLRAAFQEIARRNPARCVLINADRPVDKVAEIIWQTAQTRLDI